MQINLPATLKSVHNWNLQSTDHSFFLFGNFSNNSQTTKEPNVFLYMGEVKKTNSGFAEIDYSFMVKYFKEAHRRLGFEHKRNEKYMYICLTSLKGRPVYTGICVDSRMVDPIPSFSPLVPWMINAPSKPELTHLQQLIREYFINCYGMENTISMLSATNGYGVTNRFVLESTYRFLWKINSGMHGTLEEETVAAFNEHLNPRHVAFPTLNWNGDYGYRVERTKANIKTCPYVPQNQGPTEEEIYNKQTAILNKQRDVERKLKEFENAEKLRNRASASGESISSMQELINLIRHNLEIRRQFKKELEKPDGQHAPTVPTALNTDTVADLKPSLPRIKPMLADIDKLLEVFAAVTGAEVATALAIQQGIPEKAYETTVYVLASTSILFPTQSTKEILHKRVDRLLSKEKLDGDRYLSIFVMLSTGLYVLEVFSGIPSVIYYRSELYRADHWLNKDPTQKNKKLLAMEKMILLDDSTGTKPNKKEKTEFEKGLVDLILKEVHKFKSDAHK